MLRLKSTLDGNTIRFDQNPMIKYPKKVIVTFLDSIEDFEIDKWEMFRNSLSHFSNCDGSNGFKSPYRATSCFLQISQNDGRYH